MRPGALAPIEIGSASFRSPFEPVFPRGLCASSSGNLGDSKALGGGLWEARLMFGPGYRLYFGLHDGQVIVLLVGGDKGSQRRDIARARVFWRDFVETNDET